MHRVVGIGLAFIVASGCKTGERVFGPTGPVEAVSIDFCDLRPAWMAVQSTGDLWRQVTIPASGPVTFDATEKVSIAVTLNFFGTITQIVNVTRDELNAGFASSLGCVDESFGDRELSGTVSGLATGDYAVISAGTEVTYQGTNDAAWTLSFLPATAVDLVAVRSLASTNTLDRIIVRRNVTPQLPPPSLQPVLSFADAVSIEVNTLTVSGTGTDGAEITGSFQTASGTTADLTSTFIASDGTINYFSVPASLQTATDLHRLEIFNSTADGGRAVLNHYQTPTPLTVTLGPELSVPTISTAATASLLRMGVQLPFQSAYPSAASVVFAQFDTDLRFVQIITSAAFTGASTSSWDLSTPDMSSANYQPSWGLANGVETQWEVDAYNGGGAPIFGTIPVVGTTVTMASRHSPSFIRTSAVVSPKGRALRRSGMLALPGRR